jgi:3D (Asp-Asp-Asp) domain-containing protein
VKSGGTMVAGRSWLPVGRSAFRRLWMSACLCLLVHCAALESVEMTESASILRRRAKPVPPPCEPIGEFEATAYCDFGITKSGALTAEGLVAADPDVLPLGSVIHVDAGKYRGVYQVMDTGALVKGRIIDIYIPGLEAATEFGRQKVQVTVLHYGRPNPVYVSCNE